MPMYSSIKAFLMSQIFKVYKNNNHDPSVFQGKCYLYKEEKKIPRSSSGYQFADVLNCVHATLAFSFPSRRHRAGAICPRCAVRSE